MSDAEPQVTALLAQFVLETKIQAIPENVRREGTRSLLNIIGCALGGSRHDAVDKAWAALQPFAGGEQVTLIGRSQRTDALTAAFINTLSSSINAFDDTHAEAIVHPSGPVSGLPSDATFYQSEPPQQTILDACVRSGSHLKKKAARRKQCEAPEFPAGASCPE